jgi:hypothetical protein
MSPRRESRRDREIREALEQFCCLRRDPDRSRVWLAWYGYRSLRERWDDLPRRLDVMEAYGTILEAEKWRRGFRPPTTFHEANGRIRARIREGQLREPGGR